MKNQQQWPQEATQNDPTSSQDGPQTAFYLIFFCFVFFTDFCMLFDFGAIWGGFWEHKLVIFGIDFLMIFACRSKIAPRAAKRGQ